LAEKGMLSFPVAKKLIGELFEIRVNQKGACRVIYNYVGRLEIIVLAVFQKKSQQTPLRQLHKAQSRLQRYTKQS
jgi:phage-related protein